MYKVALVDDDVHVLRFLEKMIPWNEYGFIVAGSFKDSVEAYEKLKLHDYHLLITDIGMPRLNGIELIQLLKQEEIDLHKVILSCHDEFHYAQQALRLGAFDYILKESIEQEIIEELLKRLKVEMDNKKQMDKEKDDIENFFKKNKFKTDFIEKLMDSNYKDDDPWWKEMDSNLYTDFTHEHCIPVLCFVDKINGVIEKFENESLFYFSINNIIYETIKRDWKDVQIFYLEYKFFIVFPHGDGKASMVEQSLQEVNSKLNSFLNLTITTMIGKSSKELKGLIDSMRELLRSEIQRFYYPHGTINYLKVVPFEKPTIFKDYMEVIEELTTNIIKEDEEKVIRIIKDQLEKMRTLRCNPPTVRDWSVKLVLDVKLRLDNFSYYKDSIPINMTEKLINRVYSADYLEEMIIEICKQMIQHIKQIEDIPKSGEIAKVQKYIQLNIHRKITLGEVANYLHLNPSYFSRLFKKETGEGFIDYVTRIKMEHAKELLKYTTKTVDQISIDLGFESKSYFLKTFKKFFGVPPISYRYTEKVIPK
jgi:two-component system, response regulator YesN